MYHGYFCARLRRVLGYLCLALLAWLGLTLVRQATAGPLRVHGHVHYDDGPATDCTVGGTWLWSCSPEEEKRVVAALYNRYCVRCHAQDGRGVWDIPGVPSFADPRWQACRTDGQIVRILVEGRGGIMPAFRGTLSLEEDWAMARYLRTFVPGQEATPPYPRGSEKDDEKKSEKNDTLPMPKKLGK
jgi:hypothetical protein